ncbi:MAG: S24/S26 family peptidase [Clostridia bacterium]|nr:S24/S26 family peptidase [Clostridia bacterium]
MAKVHLSEMLPVIEEMLKADGKVTFIPEGISMQPVIVGGRDSVTIKKPKGRLQKYDACLYRRENGGFVLHRVIKVMPDSYIMSGDNQYAKEKGIRDEQIIGILVSINKNGREIECGGFFFRFYVFLISNPFSKFLKKNLARVRNRLSKIKNKFIGDKNED